MEKLMLSQFSGNFARFYRNTGEKFKNIKKLRINLNTAKLDFADIWRKFMERSPKELSVLLRYVHTMPCGRMQHNAALPCGKSCSAYAANAIAST